MDWDQVDTLLRVIHQVASAGPKYAKWGKAAEDELEGLWAKPDDEPAAEDAPVAALPPVNGRRV